MQKRIQIKRVPRSFDSNNHLHLNVTLPENTIPNSIQISNDEKYTYIAYEVTPYNEKEGTVGNEVSVTIS